MYAQNPVDANTIFPRLCRWCSFRNPFSLPDITRRPATIATNAVPVWTMSVNTSTANIVENQCASSESSR